MKGSLLNFYFPHTLERTADPQHAARAILRSKFPSKKPVLCSSFEKGGIMQLSNKTDSEILLGFSVWVAKEREAASRVLHYLREIEERKLYLREASSLFEFCMKVHKYSRHEAQNRIDAMRLLKSIPEIDADIDSGKLSLTVAAQTQSAFRQEDARRKAAGEKLMSEQEQKAVLCDLMSASTREADRKLATHFPAQLQAERTKPVTQNITRIEFNADPELMKILERLQAVYFHQTGGSWEKLVAILAEHEVKTLDAPPRRARGINSERETRTPNRHIPKVIHQEVWSSWERGCDYELENGERCASRRNLQIDHIVEFSQGGTNSSDNLRLTCGAHNRHRSDRLEDLRREFMERIEDQRRRLEVQMRDEGFRVV